MSFDARDKPGGRMLMFEGWCASQVLWSAISGEVGDGDPFGNKDAGIIDVLETMEVLQILQVGIRASPSPKEGRINSRSRAHLH